MTPLAREGWLPWLAMDDPHPGARRDLLVALLLLTSALPLLGLALLLLGENTVLTVIACLCLVIAVAALGLGGRRLVGWIRTHDPLP